MSGTLCERQQQRTPMLDTPHITSAVVLSAVLVHAQDVPQFSQEPVDELKTFLLRQQRIAQSWCCTGTLALTS